MQSSLEKRVGAIAIISAGFKEVGPEGAELESEIAKLCRAQRVPMLGPNCVGVINTQHEMNATIATQMPSTGGISVISQSGAVCASILDLAAARQLGLAKLIGIGNKADLTEEWEVDTAAVEDLEADGWTVIQTSAKTGQGVEDAFQWLARKMLDS